MHVPAALRECWAHGPHKRRATPRGRPSQGTAGSNPRTGGHQPKDWEALPFNTVGYREFFLDFGGYVSEVARCSGTLVWGLVCRSWFSSAIPFTFSRSLALLLTLCQLHSCLRQFSSTLTEQSSFRSCFTQYAGRCIPSRRRFHFRLIAPVQGIEDNIQRDMRQPKCKVLQGLRFRFLWFWCSCVRSTYPAERARRACQDVSVVYATEFAYYTIHEQFRDDRCCSCTVRAPSLVVCATERAYSMRFNAQHL